MATDERTFRASNKVLFHLKILLIGIVVPGKSCCVREHVPGGGSVTVAVLVAVMVVIMVVIRMPILPMPMRVVRDPIDLSVA